MISLLIVYAALTLVCVGMLWRNSIVYRIRMEGLDRTHRIAQAMIWRGEDWRPLHQRWENAPSYDRMLFNLTLWRPEQAYPWLYPERAPRGPVIVLKQ